MEQFIRAKGIAAPLMRINIDTDQIIPARFLVRTSKEGIGEGLFADWRKSADFILNREPFDRAVVILADRNFGCGSSREAAPQALRDRGFRAVIAPSFGGIFYNNCFRNGIVPVEMPIENVRQIAGEMEASGGRSEVTVDLEALRVSTAGGLSFDFIVPSMLREMMLAGKDEIEMTLEKGERIHAFRLTDKARRPWAYALAPG
jgi:3-isopropylmalate/(R)-2-methylmalate dehydratase small subunit